MKRLKRVQAVAGATGALTATFMQTVHSSMYGSKVVFQDEMCALLKWPVARNGTNNS